MGLDQQTRQTKRTVDLGGNAVGVMLAPQTKFASCCISVSAVTPKVIQRGNRAKQSSSVILITEFQTILKGSDTSI